jgi:hypothetical protein
MSRNHKHYQTLMKYFDEQWRFVQNSSLVGTEKFIMVYTKNLWLSLHSGRYKIHRF